MLWLVPLRAMLRRRPLWLATMLSSESNLLSADCNGNIHVHHTSSATRQVAGSDIRDNSHRKPRPCTVSALLLHKLHMHTPRFSSASKTQAIKATAHVCTHRDIRQLWCGACTAVYTNATVAAAAAGARHAHCCRVNHWTGPVASAGCSGQDRSCTARPRL